MDTKLHAYAIFLAALSLAGCGSNSGSDSGSNGAVDSVNETRQIEFSTIYPQADLRGQSSFCEPSSGSGLHGCFVSESCLADGDASQLYIVSFSQDGTQASRILRFLDNDTCAGTPLTIGLSALDLGFSVGEDIISESGLSVQEIDARLDIETGSLGTFTTYYYSSFYLEDNRLCFPEGEYNWSSESIGLFYESSNVELRPTNINFDTCLVRLE